MTDLALVAVGMVAATQQGPTDISFAATPDILWREEALISAMAYTPVVRTVPIRPTRSTPERFNPVRVTPYSVSQKSGYQTSGLPDQAPRELSTFPEFSPSLPTVASVSTSAREAALVQRMAAVSDIPVSPARLQPQFSDRSSIQAQAAYSHVRPTDCPILTVPSNSRPVSNRAQAIARVVARQASPVPTHDSRRIHSLPSREVVWTTFRY